MNDLDRAIIAVKRSLAALPEFLRRLGEGNLWVYVRYHPEIEGGTIQLKDGMAMPFSQVKDAEGPLVQLFSSFERASEAMQKVNAPARTFSVASVPAKPALAMLARMNLRAVLNASCQTGQIIIPPITMRDVADGSALRPSDSGPVQRVRLALKMIDPADYPTGLVQPAFEILRRHRNFRAAWIFEFGEEPPTPNGGQRYRLMVLMEPWDAAIFHELNLVVHSALDASDKVEIGHLGENDSAYIASLWQQVPSFYTASDYVRPPGAKQ